MSSVDPIVKNTDACFKTDEEIRTLFSQYVKSNHITIEINTNDPKNKALFIDALIKMGEIEQIYMFCNSLDPEELVEILNMTPHEMYHGNVLSSTLYYYNGESAKELYIYFRNRGAIPCLDSYNEFPWEQTGCCRTCMFEYIYQRNEKDFIPTFSWIKNYEKEWIENYNKSADCDIIQSARISQLTNCSACTYNPSDDDFYKFDEYDNFNEVDDFKNY